MFEVRFKADVFVAVLGAPTIVSVHALAVRRKVAKWTLSSLTRPGAT